MADADVVATAEPGAWPPKEMQRLVAVSTQGPLGSFTRALRLENMLHLTPNCSDDRASLVDVGDTSPDFSVVGTDGRAITLDSLRGRPAIIRFSRAASETMVCPICMPAIEDLKTTYPQFEAAGIPLVMVFSTSEAQTAAIESRLGLNYPLYTDPSWDVFGAYGTGHMLGAPKQAWVVLDADGVVRWTWRTGEDGAAIGPMPMPMEVLAKARAVLGLD